MEESKNPQTSEKLPKPLLKTRWWRWLAVSLLTLISANAAGVLIILMMTPDLDKGVEVSTPQMLAMIAVYLPLILIFAKIFHGQALRPFVTEHPKFRWKRLFTFGGIWLILILFSESVMFALNPGRYTWNFDPQVFPGVLAMSLLLVPFQAAAEEVVIRGYMLQGLSRLLRQKWVAMVITSLVFFALHGANPEFVKYGWGFALSNYLVFGLLFGALTILDRGLEAAIGIHVVNNIYSTLLVSFSDSAVGNQAVVSIVSYDPWGSTVAFLIACGMVLGVFLGMKKKEVTPSILLSPEDRVTPEREIPPAEI